MKTKLHRLFVILALGVSHGVHSESTAYGLLEREGSNYVVRKVLTDKSMASSPFGVQEKPSWQFDWVDLQPAFPTKRFECRNPGRPLKCFREGKERLPVCRDFDMVEPNLVKLALTKSSYGDTPEERGTPSRWSKMSATEKAAAVAGGVLVGPGAAVGTAAAVIVMSPFIAIAAIAQPECVGWNTKWVEFDHDEFGKRVRRGLAEVNQDNPDSRALIAVEYGRFLAARDELVKSEAGKIQNELDLILMRAGQYEAVFRGAPLRGSLPKRPSESIDKWAPESIYTDIESNFDAASQASAEQIKTHYGQRRELILAGAISYVEQLKLAAAEAAAIRFNSADSAGSMATLIADIEKLPEFSELVFKAREKQTKMALAEKSKRDLDERQRLEHEKREELSRRAHAKKMEIAIAGFRKTLKIGADTNCGPVVELRPPMVKVAFAVKDYGTEHWIKLSHVFPPGAGCRFFNGQYVPPNG